MDLMWANGISAVGQQVITYLQMYVKCLCNERPSAAVGKGISTVVLDGWHGHDGLKGCMTLMQHFCP